MRAARGYESPTAILNPGQLPILEPELFTRPKPTGTWMPKKLCSQSLLDAALSSAISTSEQLGNGNKVGSPLSTLAGLLTPGVEDCP